MARLSLHPGVWSSSLGFVTGGMTAVFSAAESQTPLAIMGWASVGIGVLLGLWGLKLDREHWWRKRRKAPRKLNKTERGVRLVESLRKARGSDPLPYLAHIEFISNAQLPLLKELDSKFVSAGWQTNPGSVPHDRYAQRYAVGIEVSGYNRHIVELVAEILNALGYGSAISEIKSLDLTRDNPKWELAQRTVYLFIGYPAPESE